MAGEINHGEMKKMIQSLDEDWKKTLVEDLFNIWQDRAVIETTTQTMLRFTPKFGGKWFAILFPGKRGKLKLSISDFKEKINIPSLHFTRAPGDQFEKSQYGSRELFIESENQAEAVKKAFEEAFALKS